MKSKKRIFFILIILIVGIFAGGCLIKHCFDSGSKNNKSNRIVIWTWDETFNVKAAKMAVNEYCKKYPDVEIVVETKEREEILADTKNMLSAGLYDDLPDIIMIEDYDVQAVLSAYEDEFVDLTGKVNKEKFADYKTKVCSRGESMYGIPFDSGTAALFYRIDILNEAGFTEEDMENLNWDEYIEIGKTVYEKTGIPMLTLDPTDLPLVRIIMQSNGSWYVKMDGYKANIEQNKALEQALLVFRKLLTQEIGISVNGWNEFISAFQTGEVASVITGGWIISSIKANPEQEGLWRVAQIPIVKENPNAVAASNVGGSAWYVLKNSPNSKKATDFVVEMFAENDEFINSLIEEIGILPAVKDPSIYFNFDASDPFFGGQQVTKFLTMLTKDIPIVNYGSKTYEIEDILEVEFQKALLDDDMEQCLINTQIKAQAVVRE